MPYAHVKAAQDGLKGDEGQAADLRAMANEKSQPGAKLRHPGAVLVEIRSQMELTRFRRRRIR